MRARKKQKFKKIGFGKYGNISCMPNDNPSTEIARTPIQELIKLPLPIEQMENSTNGLLIIYV